MIADEFSHLIKQHVVQALIDLRPHAYGHIATYDPVLHRVRCIVPSMTDQNGNPTLTGWMPIATLSAGAGFGLQVVYAGGASVENPTGGEQVQIDFFDRTRGVATASAVFFNGGAAPPAQKLPPGAAAVAAGDVLLSNASGTLLRIHPNGDFEVYSSGKLIATTTGDVTVTAAGNATLTSSGTVTIIAAAIRLTRTAGDALLGFCTDAFRQLYNTHTHGTSGPPSPQADGSAVTSIVTGE